MIDLSQCRHVAILRSSCRNVSIANILLRSGIPQARSAFSPSAWPSIGEPIAAFWCTT